MTSPIRIQHLCAPLALVTLVASPLVAQNQKPTICLAPATVQMASGATSDGATAVRETLASYLTGPTLAVTPLNAKLSSQAREEAKQASCKYVVFTSMKLERGKSGGGFLGKMIGGAVESSAWELRGAARSTAGRVVANAAASAAAEAARGLANNVKTKDELTFDYRLETLDGAVVVKNGSKAKASSDGQDLLTPMVERAAEAIAGAAVSRTSAGAASSSLDVQPGTPPVIATNVDPCTFFSKQELESAFGVPFAPPKKGRGEPSCRFYNSNTGSVTVRAGETVSNADFDALREQIGAEAERVSGIGESAYLWGPKLYVLNNGRQLIIYVSTDQLTPQLRSALTSLGRLGAPRLRA